MRKMNEAAAGINRRPRSFAKSAAVVAVWLTLFGISLAALTGRITLQMIIEKVRPSWSVAESSASERTVRLAALKARSR